MSNLYRGPSIDASYQVSVHMAEGFQRRRMKCENLTDDRRRTPSDGKSSHCLWQGELIIFCDLFSTNQIPSNIHTLSLSVAVILKTASPIGCNSVSDFEYGGFTLCRTVISTLDVPFIVGAALYHML